jgi:hypothetical protein
VAYRFDELDWAKERARGRKNVGHRGKEGSGRELGQGERDWAAKERKKGEGKRARERKEPRRGVRFLLNERGEEGFII